MTAEEYIHQELVAGRLTLSHIKELVLEFQALYGLDEDGKPGPKTRRIIEVAMKKHNSAPPVLHCPLPTLVGTKGDYRKAVVTSGFHTNNPSRPTHNGIDFFYRWQEGDKPDFVGDKGCAGKTADGKPKWVVPYGVNAIAAESGVVQIAGNSSTGYRLWIDHGNGWRTGYFHLLNLKVSVGQRIVQGQDLGLVGDNPKDHDGRHLHFELSPVDRYAPVDPEPYLVK